MIIIIENNLDLLDLSFGILDSTTPQFCSPATDTGFQAPFFSSDVFMLVYCDVLNILYALCLLILS